MPELYLQLANDEDESARRAPAAIGSDEAIALLERAEMSGETLVPWGSNYTFAVALHEPETDEVVQFGIYKPAQGERSLWDFPDDTLYLRERASWLLSDLLGWDIVPPTVIRDGPFGIGSLQLYVEPAAEMPRREAMRFWSQKRPELERMVLFDLVANNADRKLTHCLIDIHDRIWGIDHGLTFNVVPKLRTVLWQFVGDPISVELLGDLVRAREDKAGLRERLAGVLDEHEIVATIDRIDALLAAGCHPRLDPNRNIPYGWW